MSAITTSNGQTRCYAAKAPEVGPPLIQNGVIHLQAHHIGWIVSGIFAIIASVASFWLINKHVQWYTNKKEQRYIVRILFMVPIYAWISFASYLFWNHSTPLVLIRDCYEAIVLTAFFYLLLAYISPDVVEQKEVFMKLGLSREHDLRRQRKGDPPQKWVIPLGYVKWKPADGLQFLQFMKWGILQYCVIRPIATFISVILNYVGLYCESSWSPSWGHVYLTAIVSLSVTVAMYCLIQVYVIISEPLKPHKPLLKFFAVKAVVFLTFWQTVFLSMLTMFGVVKDTKYMTADNIIIGIGTIIECVEMTIFAFLHIRCFTYKEYVPNSDTFKSDISHQRTPRLRSLSHAMNFSETFREFWSGCVYFVRRVRGEETDKLIRRTAIMQGAFGRSRIAAKAGFSRSDEKLVAAVHVKVEEAVYADGEQQGLGVEDDRWHTLDFDIVEKNEGLLEQIENELATGKHSAKGRESSDRDAEAGQGHVRGRQSWWRSVYNRVSQTGADEKFTPPPPRRSSRMRSNNRKSTAMSSLEVTYDDPPPFSKLGKYKNLALSRTKNPTTPPSTDFRQNDSNIQAESTTSPVLHSTSQLKSAPGSLPEQPASLLTHAFSYIPKDRHVESRDVSSEHPFIPEIHRSEARVAPTEQKAAKMRVLSEIPEIVEPDVLVDDSRRGSTLRPAEERDPAPAIASFRFGSCQLSSDPVSPFTSHSRDSSPTLPATRRSRPAVDSNSGFPPPAATSYRSAHKKPPPGHRPSRDQISLPKPLAPASYDYDLSLPVRVQRSDRPYVHALQRKSLPRGSRNTRRTPVPYLVQSLPPTSGSLERSGGIHRSSKDTLPGHDQLSP